MHKMLQASGNRWKQGGNMGDSDENDINNESTGQEYLDYNDNIVDVDPITVATVGQRINEDGSFITLIKAKRSDFVASLI